MRKSPLLLLAVVVGVALWAAPSSAQVADFFKRYVADSAAPGEGNTALDNGAVMCPRGSTNCSGPDQAHHHINGAVAAADYNTDVLDVHNCNFVTVCVRTTDVDGVTGNAYVEGVSNDAAANATRILGDVDGDGVISGAADNVPLDGDRGTDNDGDGTARQTMCLYDITGINKLRLAVDPDAASNHESYAEVSCR